MAETRASLLLRVRNLQDEESWREFLDLYGPLILRYLGKLGIFAHDAQDLLQDVMQILIRRLPTFEYDPQKGSFRNWLCTVTTNRARRFFREKQRRDVPHGGTSNVQMVEGLPDDGPGITEIWEDEWRRRRLEAAMEKVRSHVRSSTWESFELTALEGLDPNTVAKRLNISVGQVYVNKSRVLKRLRETVENTDD